MISNQAQLATKLVDLFTTHATITAYTPTAAVLKMKYRPQHLPDFDKFAIIISPFSEREQHERHTNSLEYIEGVQIVAIVRNYDEVLSVYGTTAPNIGILQHCQNIKDVLRSRTLTGLVTVTKHEFDEEIKFSEVVSENRDFFYHEAIMLWLAEVADPNPMPEPLP